MSCPTVNRANAEAQMERVRAEVIHALSPLVQRHGAGVMLLATAHVLGKVIGTASAAGLLDGRVAVEVRHVQDMVAEGVQRATGRVQPVAGRA